ncbi:uncharacterized protein [Acropora muricata]|uniref:uncharacterized protein isoform X3 n=1 Tax=Acropora muricata TaxID=159855 RepID=UPI0034E61235
MMKTTGLLVVFTLLVILYQTSAVPVASSYKLENENIMDVMEAKEKSEEASEEEKEEESDKEEEKQEDKEDEKEEKEDEDKKDDEESKDDEEKKEDEEEAKDDEEKKDDEAETEQKEEDNESSAEESEDLELDGSGKGKDVSTDSTEKEKETPEKRSISDPKKTSKSSQVKRQYYGGYGGAGCGGCCGTNDWCAGGTMCSNCKGGFYPPVTCSGCNTGCCPGITFPCVFGASVNNPGCECCKEKTPPGKCKWPCMWPCCCTCTPPKFEFKPLKPEPVCHCPSPHSHHTACGNHCLKRTARKGPVRRSLKHEIPSAFLPTPYSYGYAPIISPFYDNVPNIQLSRAY